MGYRIVATICFVIGLGSWLVAFDGFVIRVVDADSKRPVPLVELKTTNQIRYVTDNHGLIAITDPDLLNREIFFSVASHGYEFPKDGFGMVGRKIELVPGEEIEISLKRINVAERLYRITGGGRYTYSKIAGRNIAELPSGGNSNVFGCDSVLTAIYQNRLFWIWGDTNRPGYPLGNFHSTAATSNLPFDPEKGIDLDYFKDGKGFVRPIARMPGKGPTWLTGLTVVKDRDGKERLGAMYQKVKGFLTIYESGLCEFDPVAVRFQKLFSFEENQTAKPQGHPFVFEDENGKEWIIYADPLPTMRVPASYESWRDPSQYEPLSVEASFHDPSNGEVVQPHRGSIAWNQYRQRWVMIFCETRARKKKPVPSRLGEIWYAESTSPMGPWNQCRKVLTHRQYSFYNPKQHPCYARERGRIIYFEGTYTATFSGTKQPTPRYDYNQILYRLDLDDPRLAMDQ